MADAPIYRSVWPCSHRQPDEGHPIGISLAIHSTGTCDRHPGHYVAIVTSRHLIELFLLERFFNRVFDQNEMADEDDGGAREVYVDSDSGDDFLGFGLTESGETASYFDRLPQRCDRSIEADLFDSDSDSPESKSTVVYTLPSSSTDDVDVSDDDDYTPRRRKLPRHNPSGQGTRVGTQGGARVPTGPDGDAGGSGRGRARRGRGWRGCRHGDGRGDADRRQTANPTLPDGTEVLWQPDNGMQPDWLQDLAGATGKPTFDDTDYRPVDYFQRTFPN